MPFNYYHRLSRRSQSTYRKSDNITEVDFADTGSLRRQVAGIERGLAAGNRDEVQRDSLALVLAVCGQLAIPPLEVTVLAKRPSDDWGELHGLYEPEDPPRRAQITVWMRTAKRDRIVAFKTFLRTLLHELGHHLDYEYYRLEESFHTEGFYQRENHMFHTLTRAPAISEPVQQTLFPDP